MTKNECLESAKNSGFLAKCNLQTFLVVDVNLRQRKGIENENKVLPIDFCCYDDDDDDGFRRSPVVSNDQSSNVNPRSFLVEGDEGLSVTRFGEISPLWKCFK